MTIAEGFFLAGTVPFALLGSAHIALTLRDLRRPTYFTPTAGALVAELQGTGVAVLQRGPGSRTMWRAWLGFNLSHGLGLVVFAVLLLAVALHNYALVSGIPVIRLVSLLVPVTYLLLALRFWFVPPAAGVGIGFACFVVAALA